jgi:hypothetical protein
MIKGGEKIMWKSKKFIVLSSVLAVVLLFGATAGIALAQGGTDTKPGPREALLSKVAQILGIPQDKLVEAFKKAGAEQRDLNLKGWLDKLLKDGKITQQQIDQFKAWLAAKPAGTPRDNADKFKEWMKQRPDMPLPNPGNFGPGPGPGRGPGLGKNLPPPAGKGPPPPPKKTS